MIRALYKRILSERQRNAVRAALRKCRAPMYYGDNYFCVFCNKGYRKFLPKGDIQARPNAECPGCGSLERTRLLYYFLRDRTDIYEQHLNVLHFAPEESLKNVMRNLNINYIDADLNPNLASTVVDITQMQFADDMFDLIICSHVLGHVAEEHKALKEILRVMKPTGEAIVLTWQGDNEMTIPRSSPVTPAQELAFRNDDTLERLHGLDFGETLSRTRFEVERLDYRAHFSDEEKRTYSLGNGKREILWILRPKQLTAIQQR